MGIRKLLVANRGEIAVRVFRTCRELGIATVAVAAPDDERALHTRAADQTVPIRSYLDSEEHIRAATLTGSDAIHPGYGFLAENAAFARLCEDEGLVFIGPSSKALELVGDKVKARLTMEKAGVAAVPGMMSVSASPEEFRAAAAALGYPVMVKASAGGGGKGMRIVREARSAFGDDSVYLEKYIEEPRHVEFQVLADNRGRTVHIFERECSIQRRHQKILEESPSPALDPGLRREMGETAVRAMKAAG
jgi:acetyl/propionyl-CoA carboxylase alpha subunit